MNNESVNTHSEQAVKPDIANAAIDYAETYYNLALVKLQLKTADISAASLFGIIVAVMIAFILLFIGIAGGIYLGNIIHHRAIGFLLISAVYLILLAFFLLAKKKIFLPFIKNLIINIIYE